MAKNYFGVLKYGKKKKLKNFFFIKFGAPKNELEKIFKKFLPVRWGEGSRKTSLPPHPIKYNKKNLNMGF